MLVCGWAMWRVSGIGIRSAAGIIGLITLISGPAAGTHLTAEEQGNPDQERGGHDQWRCQRLQIGKHPGASSFTRTLLYLALLLMMACSVARAPGPRGAGHRHEQAAARGRTGSRPHV
jgi:hypothetical protein